MSVSTALLFPEVEYPVLLFNLWVTQDLSMSKSVMGDQTIDSIICHYKNVKLHHNGVQHNTFAAREISPAWNFPGDAPSRIERPHLSQGGEM
jgi:phage pi2 protein 07